MPGDSKQPDEGANPRAAEYHAAELAAAKEALRSLIRWRDLLAEEVARFDGIISGEARRFATLNGDLVKPSLPQLRRMLELE
jgi:hypothetical protein